MFRNFWFSYKNILYRAILKKKYFAFLRKIFGTLFKFLRKFYLINFSSDIENWDKIEKNKFKNLYPENLLTLMFTYVFDIEIDSNLARC